MSGDTPDLPQHDLPPWPWPDQNDSRPWESCSPGPDECLGGYGTIWYFKSSALRNRLLALGMGSEYLETIALFVGWANGRLANWQSGGCDVLEPSDDPDPTLVYFSPLGANAVTTVQVVRADINATLGGFETLTHQTHWRRKGGATGTQDEALMMATAEKIRDAWADFFASTRSYLSSTAATNTWFASDLTYTNVTCSLITQEDGKPPPKPTVDVGGQVATFPSSGAGSAKGTASAQGLPFEVACCLTLRTDTAGPTTRGRLYLGGLAGSETGGYWMNSPGTPSTSGLFNGIPPKVLGNRFGLDFVDALHTDSGMQYDMHILSRRTGTSRGVGGVSVGVVPDSQRRRRWSQPENRTLVWGT